MVLRTLRQRGWRLQQLDAVPSRILSRRGVQEWCDGKNANQHAYGFRILDSLVKFLLRVCTCLLVFLFQECEANQAAGISTNAAGGTGLISNPEVGRREGDRGEGLRAGSGRAVAETMPGARIRQ